MLGTYPLLGQALLNSWHMPWLGTGSSKCLGHAHSRDMPCKNAWDVPSGVPSGVPSVPSGVPGVPNGVPSGSSGVPSVPRGVPSVPSGVPIC